MLSLAKVPSLHWLSCYWCHEFCSSDERGSMLRLRELLKHTSVMKPVVWSSTHKGQVQIGSGVPAPGGETGCTLWIVEQQEVIICCPHNQTLSVGCIASVSPLCPHCTCWQLISPAYTHGEENTGRDIVKRRKDGSS